MKNLLLLMCLFTVTLQAQNTKPSKSIDGHYTTLFKERGTSGPSDKKVIQLAENNGTVMLAVAACEKCFPALFTYKEEMSKEFGKPVFGNTMGFYVLTYDKDSFVIVLPEVLKENDFNFSNFYSKDVAKVKTMTKEKIEAYASKILDMI